MGIECVYINKDILAAKDAEIERLREALKPFARAAKDAGIDPHDETFDLKFSHVKDMALDRGCFRLARAALETN